MSPIEWIAIILVAVLAILVLTPPVFCWLGMTRMNCRDVGNASDAAHVPDDAENSLLEQFHELGFQVLGKRIESATLFGPHWIWNSLPQRILVSNNFQVVGLIYRMFRIQPPAIGFITRFDDDTMLYTSNNVMCGTESIPGYRCVQIDATEVAVVLERHRQEVASIVAEGPQSTFVYTLDQVNENTRLSFEKIAAAGSSRALGPVTLATAATMIFLSLVMFHFVIPNFLGNPLLHYSMSVAIGLLAIPLMVWSIPLFAMREFRRKQLSGVDMTSSDFK